MKKIILVILALPVIHYASFAQTKNLTVDANDVLNNNSKIVAQTSAGQIFFTGHQIGSTYANPSGIFRAWTDNSNGAANYFFDGVVNATTNFSVRADGQGYFAGNVGIGTTAPVAGLSTEAGQNAAISPLTDVPNGSAWIGGAGTTGGLSMGQFSGNYGYIQSRNKAANKTPYQLALNPLGGFVGIGTAAPSSILHVVDANATLLTLERAISTGNMNIQYKNNTYAIFAGLNTNGGFSVGTTANFTNSSILTATADGNVGIGSYTPQTALSVVNSTPIIQLFDKENSPRDGTSMGKIAFGSGISEFASVEASRTGTAYDDVSSLKFKTSNSTTAGGDGVNLERMRISPNGNVGIGTMNPQNKLDVNGTIHSKSVLIDLNGWSDYVFHKDYKLPSLANLKTYIDQNQHLPEIPSEQEIVKKGLDVGEMNKLLMKKVEELTLYLIEMKTDNTKQMKSQEKQIRKLKEQLNKLTNNQTKKITTYTKSYQQ